ncbi:TetR/AcrR family transcriptional regulator C-terminal domain-containing protein [Spirillospora sp. NPDC048819]|uniref:TetR/AcrR family transcriptional regulator n=1 Tax=Spirillospora sp. NPDC048819 TaxID=3155268 RepID=UPI00340DA09B
MRERNESDEGGLPETVELAWGLRERPGKGPRRTLSLKGIVEAAVAVGAAEGLDALSMSRVAREAGASTMALYRYVASKNDLLALVLDELLGEPPGPPDPGTGWREALRDYAMALREVTRRHPWALRIPVTGPPAMPNNVAWMEAGLRRMRGMGLDAGTRLSVLMQVTGYVRYQSTLIADLESAYRAAGTSDRQVAIDYGNLLAALTADDRRFPEIRALLESKIFAEPGDDTPEDDFAFGLDCLLDGLEALVRRGG